MPAAAGPLGASVPRPFSGSDLITPSPKLLGFEAGVGCVPGSVARVVVAARSGEGAKAEEEAKRSGPRTGAGVGSAEGNAASVTNAGGEVVRVGFVCERG